jgi:hypothetical protein
MKRQSAHLFVAVILALLCPLAQKSRGDFILHDSEQLTVNSDHSTGTLYDTSRAFIVSGGYVWLLEAHNVSTVNISGGDVTYLRARSSSAVNISGGGVSSGLSAYGLSKLNISGGSVNSLYAIEHSTVNISGGDVTYGLQVSGSSTANISGGSIQKELYISNLGIANISGGSVGTLKVYSSANISGGSLSDLLAYNSSTVIFHGLDFLASGGLTLSGERVLGTGILSGKWMDGTPWTVNISGNEPTATILAVPAPYILTIDVDPNDVGIDTVTPDVGTHSRGGWVSIKAERFVNCPDVYTFDHWEGDANDPNLADTTVFMDSDKTITSVFVSTRQCGDECHPYPLGDIDKNCIVDFNDFGLFALSWLECTKPECD